MDQSDMMRPVQFSDTYYYGIRPTISKVAAEMDDMLVAYPTQAMYDSMLDRVYGEMAKIYPEEMQDQLSNPTLNSPDYHAEQFFPPFRRRRFVRDLLGILLLEELFERRRRF